MTFMPIMANFNHIYAGISYYANICVVWKMCLKSLTFNLMNTNIQLVFISKSALTNHNSKLLQNTDGMMEICVAHLLDWSETNTESSILVLIH